MGYAVHDMIVGFGKICQHSIDICDILCQLSYIGIHLFKGLYCPADQFILLSGGRCRLGNDIHGICCIFGKLPQDRCNVFRLHTGLFCQLTDLICNDRKALARLARARGFAWVKSAVISTTPGARNRAGGVASPLNTVAFTAAAFVTALQDARTCASPAAGAAGRAGASSEQPTARARQNPKTTPTARDSLTEFRIRGLYHKTASATETVRRVRALPRGGASPARSPE